MPWDSPAVYIVYTLFFGVCAIIISFFRISTPPLRRGLRFLLTYSGVSFVVGWLINRLAFSPTQLLLISGREGIALSIFALIMSFLLVLYQYRKEPTSMRLRQLLALITLAGLLLAIWGIPLSEQGPAPQGDYAIGSTAHHLIDQDREEILTRKKGDLRELMVQISYPTKAGGEGIFLSFKNSKRIQTNSLIEVPILPTGTFPLLIYAAGSGGSPLDNTSQIEALVSRGYIVAAMAPTYFCHVTFPDGHRIRAWSMDTLESRGHEPDYMTDVVQKIWLEDIYSVLDEMEFLDKDSSSFLFQRIDWEKVGVMGWSMGGSAAVEACVEDARFKAGANLDGFDWMRIEEGQAFLSPFLYFHTDVSSVKPLDLLGIGWDMQSLTEMYQGQNAREEMLFQGSAYDGYRIQIAGAFHSNYRDQGMYGLARVGPVDPQRCNELLTMYLLDFFEYHLREKPTEHPWNSNDELRIEAY